MDVATKARGVAIVAAAIVAVYASGRRAQESFARPSHADARPSHHADARPSHAFPRVMYTYWHDPAAVPDTVRECMASWARHNPGFRVVLLHPGNAAQYAPDLERLMKHPRFSDMPQRTSDLVRVCVLARHGGYWVDASVFMRAPLDAWIVRGAPTDVEFAGFTLKNVLENWFFACIPNSPFVRAWRDEFLSLQYFESADAYVDAVRADGVDLAKLYSPTYLAQHAAALRVLKRYDSARMFVFNAEDAALKSVVDVGWHVENSLRRECDSRRRSPLVKFVGPQRHELERDPDLRRCVLA